MDRKLRNSIFFIYSLLFATTPLIMFHKTSELFEFNKLLYIYAATILIVCLWIVRMIIHKRIIFSKTLFVFPLLIFVGSQLLSTYFSIDRHTSLFGYYGRFNGGLFSLFSYSLLYLAFVSNITSYSLEDAKKIINRFIKITLISSTIVILWGIPGKFGYDLTCLLFTGSLNTSCWTAQFNPMARMFSTLGQPNWLGAYLAISFFMLLYFFFKKELVRRQSLYFSLLILYFCAVLFTRSRSALLAVSVGLVVFFIYLHKEKGNLFVHKKLLKKISILLLGFGLSIILFKTGVPSIDKFYTLNLNKNIQQQASPSASTPTNVTGSLDIRRIVWKGAFELGKRYPMFGTGVETFAYSYYFVRPIEHNVTSEWDFIYNKAHNEYLNYFATTGLVGLFSYLLLIGTVYFGVMRFLKTKKSEKRLVQILALSYTTILITNFFGFSTTVTSLYFYLIPAFIFTLGLPDENFREITQSTSLVRKQKFTLVLPIIIAIAGMMYIFLYFVADINYAYGDNYLSIQEYDVAQGYLLQALMLRHEPVYEDKLTQALVSSAFLKSAEDTSKETLARQIQFAEYYGDRVIASSPQNIIYWRNRARNYFLLYQAFGDTKYFEESLRALAKSKQISPTDPKSFYTEALFYSTRMDEKLSSAEKDVVVNKVLQNIDRAIELKPNYRDAYYLKGLTLKKLKRNDEAKKAFEFILQTINPNDEEVQKELEK